MNTGRRELDAAVFIDPGLRQMTGEADEAFHPEACNRY
jgi:hypothetical protein